MLVHGVLAGSQIALVSLRKTRVDQLVSEGKKGALAIKGLRDDPERFIATVQISMTALGAAAGAFGGTAVAREIEPLVASVPMLAGSSHTIAFVVTVGLITYWELVLGELVPKSLGLRAGETYVLLFSRPLLWLAWISRPLVWFLTTSSNLVLRVFGDSTSFSESRLSPGEIQQLVDEASEVGAMDPAAGEIASRAIDFADLTVGHVMVPRKKVVGIPRTASPDDIRRIVLEHGKMRMPVYDELIDNVTGYVTVRDLMTLFVERQLLVLEDAIRPAFKVPEMMRAVDLLAEMRKRRIQLAIVVEEGGAMSGIVTIEDLVEELVGEIASEHEAPEPASVQLQPDQSLVVRGDVPIRDLNREHDLELPEGDTWSTIAGLTLELAGRIPKTGDKLKTEDGTVLEVLVATPRQVRRVRVIKRGDAA